MSIENNQAPGQVTANEPEGEGVSLTYWLLLAIPVALALRWFAVSLVAIYPLAEIMAKATETLAETLGPTIGGLLYLPVNAAQG